MSVQEALGLMAPAFRQIEPANLKFIEAIVATYIEKEEKQVRLVAVQYAGEVFSHDNVASRYTLLLGAGDIKDDVARASQAALYSGLKKANNPDVQKRKKTAVELGPVLASLPTEAPLYRLKQFLTAAIQAQVSSRHGTMVLRGLLHSEHLQVRLLTRSLY